MSTFYYGPKIAVQTTLANITEIAFGNQVAGEAVAQYQPIYRNGAFWLRADASDPATAPPQGPLGIAQNAAASGATLPVWIRALVSNGAWLFASGLPVFAGSGPGNLVQSAPETSGSVSLKMGWSPQPFLLDLNPQTGVLIAQSN